MVVWRWLLVLPVVGVLSALLLGLLLPDYLFGVSVMLLVQAVIWLGVSIVLGVRRYWHMEQLGEWFQREFYTLFLAVLFLGVSEVLRCWLPLVRGFPCLWYRLPIIILLGAILFLLTLTSSYLYTYSRQRRRFKLNRLKS